MQEVTKDYLTAVEGDERVFSVRCLFEDLDDYITDTNNEIRSGVYTNIIDGNSVISMGNACSNKIEMVIGDFDRTFVWRGSKFLFEKGIEVNDATEWVPWGTFWVTDMSTSNDGRTISIVAYDRMYKLSKTPYKTSLVKDFHYRDLLDEFLENSGLTLSEDSIAKLPRRDDAAYIIKVWPEGDFSYGDIAGHLAGMVGSNARISKTDPNVLEFVWYEPTEIVIEKTLYMDGFEKLAESELRVDYLVVGDNKEKIEIENTWGSTAGELDFSQFDGEDPANLPQLTFALNDATMTASVKLTKGYESNTSKIEIPGCLRANDNLYTVTTIENNGFINSKASEIILPETITTIGDYAFYECDNLTSITIPDNVTTIGGNAFYSCNNLANVSIGNGVTTIGSYAFKYCMSLTSVTIPDSVTSIGRNAFESCTSLASVTISNGATTIDHETFSGCTSLVSVTIGNSVATIGNNAFYRCKALTSITIPGSVKTIYSNAFESCSSLTDITIHKSTGSISFSPWGATNATVNWVG